MSNPWQKQFIKIGHKGAAGHEPGNTLVSFEKAIQLGVDAIELDVRVCKTGELVVFHDETLQRITGKRGSVTNKTLIELKKMDVGKGNRMPTLEEALEVINKRVAVNIELKEEAAVLPTVEVLSMHCKEAGWEEDQFLVSSFNYEALRKFKMFYPFVFTGLLVWRRGGNYLEIAKLLKCFSVNLPAKRVGYKAVRNAHQAGLKVFAWTANESKEIKRLKESGVDGIFSDFPERL